MDDFTSGSPHPLVEKWIRSGLRVGGKVDLEWLASGNPGRVQTARGMSHLGVRDRSTPLPTSGYLELADGAAVARSDRWVPPRPRSSEACHAEPGAAATGAA